MPLAAQQGGAERLFQNLLRNDRHLFGYKIAFLESGPLLEEVRDLGYEAEVIPTSHLRDPGNYFRTVRALVRWIRTAEVDLVFSWMLKAHLYAGPAAILARTKRMWFQHGLSKRHWMDMLAAWVPSDGIPCCSGYVKSTLDKRLPSHPSSVCHPGVVLEGGRLRPRAEARRELGIAADIRVICMVARLERWKGAHVFVAAADLLAQRYPDAIFSVVGGPHPLDPDYAREIHRLAARSGLGGRLRLLGQCSATEVSLWQTSADIVVHPVTEPEPFGMAVVEALALGRAVVASDAGGIREIIEDGVSGMFVRPGDPIALSVAVDELLRDTKRREAMEEAALVRAQKFSAQAFASRFEQQLLSVLEA